MGTIISLIPADVFVVLVYAAGGVWLLLVIRLALSMIAACWSPVFYHAVTDRRFAGAYLDARWSRAGAMEYKLRKDKGAESLLPSLYDAVERQQSDHPEKTALFFLGTRFLGFGGHMPHPDLSRFDDDSDNAPPPPEDIATKSVSAAVHSIPPDTKPSFHGEHPGAMPVERAVALLRTAGKRRLAKRVRASADEMVAKYPGHKLFVTIAPKTENQS